MFRCSLSRCGGLGRRPVGLEVGIERRHELGARPLVVGDELAYSASVVIAELGVLRHREEQAVQAQIGEARLPPGAEQPPAHLERVLGLPE